MNKVITWFFLSCKRYARRFSFLAILFLLPFGALAARQAEKAGSREIKIALYVEGGSENALGARLVESLITRERSENKGMFRFYQCGSETQAREDVASRRAECGYIIYEGLDKKLDSKKYKRSIGVLAAPSTVVDALSTETVFAALMELYDRELLQDYVYKSQLFAPLDELKDLGDGVPLDGKEDGESRRSVSAGEESKEGRRIAAGQAGELYDKWLENGSTFRFEYSFLEKDGTRDVSSEDGKTPVFPVRGIAAVYIFITGLYAAAAVCRDEEKGLFLPLSSGLRTPCRVACLAAPVFMAACSSLLALWGGGVASHPSEELGAMLCYVAAVTAAAWILKAICRKPQIICCVIPFFIIGSLIFCPVFIDAGRYVEAAEQVGRLFLPWHYLDFFSM